MMHKLGQLMTWGGALMAALLQHFNNNAAAYSVLIGLIGLGITGIYHMSKYRLEARVAKAKIAALNQRRDHVFVDDETD